MYTDKKILVDFSKGDAKAFEYLYNHYHIKVFFIALHYLKSSDDAKDIRANSFMRLWEGREKLKFETFSGVYMWLRTITYNSCIDFIRKQKTITTRQETLQSVIIEANKNEIFELVDKEAIIINRMLNRLEKMPPKFKEVFKMRCYDDLKFVEIANLLKTDISTIKKRYARAVKLMKAAYSMFLL